jgi:hypothetical protein
MSACALPPARPSAGGFRCASPNGRSPSWRSSRWRPTHPTRKQVCDNPSIDPLRSLSVGDADLTATLLAGDGRVLATVSHQHFPPDLASISPAGDPWADARVAIDRFAARAAARARTSD